MRPVPRDKPYYRKNAIASIPKLAKTLELPESTLSGLRKNQSKHYYEFELKTKNNKIRRLKDPKTLLKTVQKRINSRIFVHIAFPDYLTGGLTGKDYYINASAHAKAEYIFSYDIRSFYDNIKWEEVNRIFKFLLNFPDDVSDILTDLVTLNGRVPQGAPTSSFIANLVFFDEEYKIVSKLRAKKITYTRLLDDIVISSFKKITKDEKVKISKEIAGMVKKRQLKLNNKKTKFTFRSNPSELMYVTGLWVNHANPKCSKNERKNTRAAVFQCEKEYNKSYDHRTSEEYHILWNQTSGRVAKLTRIKHSQAKNLRKRLAEILPTFSDEKIINIEREVDQLKKAYSKRKYNLGYIKRVNKMVYLAGIVSRTNKNKGKKLKATLSKLKIIKNYDQFWEKKNGKWLH